MAKVWAKKKLKGNHPRLWNFALSLSWLLHKFGNQLRLQNSKQWKPQSKHTTLESMWRNGRLTTEGRNWSRTFWTHRKNLGTPCFCTTILTPMLLQAGNNSKYFFCCDWNKFAGNIFSKCPLNLTVWYVMVACHVTLVLRVTVLKHQSKVDRNFRTIVSTQFCLATYSSSCPLSWFQQRSMFKTPWLISVIYYNKYCSTNDKQ